ncbi:MAG TPA: hypothetical protein VLS89_11075 [Candidatus Nanopelagicales bacterium]|nr:hypothetical protein [Candidatus Nanopelagicales bacterium]
MGNAISPRAAASDILADVRTTHTRATARGGKWQEHADTRLASALALGAGIETQLATARDVAAPLIAAVKVENERADDLLGRISDEIWNAIGRPGNDPAFSIIFPGGFAYYADGNTEQQPTRMEILAQLLEANLHPKLTPQQTQAYAADVRQSALQLQQTIDAARTPAARVEVLERVYTAVARSAAIELGHLKRLYKAEGFSETEIHTVIPDRPRSSGKGGTGGGEK